MENLLKRLRRIRAVICQNMRYEEEVEKCPCKRGGRDAGGDEGYETGCKDIQDAIDKIEGEE